MILGDDESKEDIEEKKICVNEQIKDSDSTFQTTINNSAKPLQCSFHIIKSNQIKSKCLLDSQDLYSLRLQVNKQTKQANPS